jgi:large subunit ribosomal protein L30
MADRLRVTQIKSTISHIARNRATVRALGLKRIGHTVEIPDNPATRGMVRQVRFLVSVEEVGGSVGDRGGTRASSGRGGGVHSRQNPSEDRGDGGASSNNPSEDGEETT